MYLGEDGTVASVQHRARKDSHRVVEEFMILANVCAAETLEAHKMACMYRIYGFAGPAMGALASQLRHLGGLV